jgi:hypothetical protein
MFVIADRELPMNATKFIRRAANEMFRRPQYRTDVLKYTEARRELAIVLAATPNDPEAKELADLLASKQ